MRLLGGTGLANRVRDSNTLVLDAFLMIGCNLALLKAIGEKHIPGMPANLRILLLGQTVTGKYSDNGAIPSETVLEHVIRSDKTREQALRDAESKSFACLPHGTVLMGWPRVISGVGKYRRSDRGSQDCTEAETRTTDPRAGRCQEVGNLPEWCTGIESQERAEAAGGGTSCITGIVSSL
jgi:hypothetical protein